LRSSTWAESLPRKNTATNKRITRRRGVLPLVEIGMAEDFFFRSALPFYYIV
jgi:hypothetical protein